MKSCECSGNVEEVRVSLPVRSERKVQWTKDQPTTAPQIQNRDFWVRICGTCSQVTFWSKPSQ
jgi:hypothetical protein